MASIKQALPLRATKGCTQDQLARAATISHARSAPASARRRPSTNATEPSGSVPSVALLEPARSDGSSRFENVGFIHSRTGALSLFSSPGVLAGVSVLLSTFSTLAAILGMSVTR